MPLQSLLMYALCVLTTALVLCVAICIGLVNYGEQQKRAEEMRLRERYFVDLELE